MKGLLYFALAIGIGLGRLIGYSSAQEYGDLSSIIVGKYKIINEESGNNFLRKFILETIAGDYQVNVVNCEKYPISKRFKEIKEGDYLKVKCKLAEEIDGKLDCFTDSCLVKKASSDDLEKMKKNYK